MTTAGLDVAKVPQNLKNVNIEQLLERVHSKLRDHIGAYDLSSRGKVV
jgi:hypothetical protein